jgi:hypothetical protein
MLLLIFAASGCYWLPQEGGVAVAFSIPKELLEKAAPDLYTATLTFTEVSYNDKNETWEVKEGGAAYEDSLAMPAFELINQGAMAIKMHSGNYRLIVLVASENPMDPKYGSGPVYVTVPVTSLAKVEVTLTQLPVLSAF